MTLREIDGGTNYYAQFANGLPTNPNFFPIGVWFESVLTQNDINLDKGAGLNTYVVLTADSNLSLVQNNGMYAILQSDEPAWLNQTAINNPAVVGWLLADEPDGVGTPAGYTILQQAEALLPDDGRFRYSNFAKAVGDGQGISDTQAAQYVNFQDVSSADIYWYTDPYSGGNTYPENMLGARYGDIVDRMRSLDAMDGVRQPIWAFVEVGWPFSQTAAEGARAIEPDEIQAAVMHSLIAGARGVIYFNHSFGGPNLTHHALRDPAYVEERAAVTEINHLITDLAPVLNSPFDDGYVTTGPSVRVMAKFYAGDGDHYVFAGSTQHAASTATFTLAGANPDMDGTAIVVNEGRSITITDGRFSDFFVDGEAWHVYHIELGAAPPPPSGAGSVSISDVTVTEGNSGTKAATFTVTRSGGTAAFDANFVTSNGTATVADSDYLAASGTLSFAANETTKTISVTINGDTKFEANETFNVVLSNPTNGATIGDGQGVGTISNDDSAPPPPAGSNLVVNGGFEAGDFSGWTLSGNTGGLYIAPTAFPGAPHSGTYSAGLGSFNTDGTITQNIATTAGQHYTLSFWIMSDNDGSTPINHFDAQWNGQTLLNLTNTPNTGYQLYTFDVVATGSASALEFDGYNHPDAWRLDDVSLTAVGEPPPPPPPDTTPPAKPAITSFADDTAPTGDGRTSDTTLVLTGTAEASSTVTVLDGTNILGTAPANSSGGWSFTTAALSLAPHSFTVKATDAAGNTSVASDPLNVVVEAAPLPGLTINGTSTHDTLRGGAGNDIINGNNGQDYLDGAAGNDTIHGNGGKDFVDGGPGQDVLWGDAGADTFIFKRGEAAGDSVMDFSGNGSRTGDLLMFVGYGDKQDGASFTRIDTTRYQIHAADGANEIINLSATVNPLDFLFI